MDALTVVIVVIIAMGVAGAAVFLALRPRKGGAEEGFKELLGRMDQFKDAMQGRFSEELHRMRQEMATHLGDNRQTLERSGQVMQKQMLDFTSGITQMSHALQEVRASMKDVASFQDILRTPKLRGQWGEASLEHLLQEFFPSGVWQRQKYFKSGEAVDAVITMPNDKLLPIDSKFPLENFQRMAETESEPDRMRFKKLFLDDARREIDSVSEKYILPSEGTTDFALLFIPAESVYYEIINNTKDADLNEYARKKRILLVSPNTLYLHLQILQRWLHDVRVSRETQDILKRLARITQDAQKLQDDFRKLGGHLTNARGAYDTAEKRLTFFVDRSQRLVGADEEETSAIAEVATSSEA